MISNIMAPDFNWNLLMSICVQNDKHIEGDNEWTIEVGKTILDPTQSQDAAATCVP